MKKTLNKVLLVDGTSHIFRAYHRMGLYLTDSQGQSIGALYTFCLMLKKLLKNYQDTSIILFFDEGGKNFRHELFEDYKANRSKPEDDLVHQIKLCHEVASYYGFPVVKQKGVEADDLIGTVAAKYAEFAEVEIHSPDKDFMQLVDQNIRVFVDEKTTYKIYDSQAVLEKYGIEASQFRDFLALKGDQSDNIPGLKGCGDKTAAKWLQIYGTLEKLLEEQDQIKGKIGEKLRAQADLVRLSQQLVTISVEQQWPECLPVATLPEPPYPDQEALQNMFEKYEFTSLLPKIDLDLNKISQKIKFQTLDQLQSMENVLQRMSSYEQKAFDIEVENGKLKGLYLCFDAQETYFFSLLSLDDLDYVLMIEKIKEAFNSGSWLGYDLKEKFKRLATLKISPPEKFDDLILIAHLIDAASSVELKALCQKHLSWVLKTPSEILKEHPVQSLEELPKKILTDNHCAQVAAIWRLYEHLWPTLESSPELLALYRDLEKPFLKVLEAMELRGVVLDNQYIQRLTEEFSHEKHDLEKQIYDLAGQTFNVASTKQLREILFEKLQLPVLAKTPKGQPSTNEAALSQLAQEYEIAQKLLSWRELEKLLTTYTHSLIAQIDSTTEAIHTQYNQTGTITGRLSSSNPNLQNIPIKTEKGRQIRQAFIAREGYELVCLDYSQIELRLMAHFSQDKSLLEAYQKGEDIHRLTASKIYQCDLSEVTSCQRREAKAVNFGLIYGMTPWGLSKQLNISLPMAQKFHDRFFEQFPGVKNYSEKMQQQAQEHRHVKTILGRVIPIREQSGSQMNYRASINGPLQGTASDLIKKAMVLLSEKFSESKDLFLILQVHDELIFEIKSSAVEELLPQITKIMEQALELSVPLIVDSSVGSSWGRN